MFTLRSCLAPIALLVSSVALAGEPVDINTADATALAEAISGVGLKRAEAIIDYRTANGPFASVDDLVRVDGGGPRILESSRHRLTVTVPTD